MTSRVHDNGTDEIGGWPITGVPRKKDLRTTLIGSAGHQGSHGFGCFLLHARQHVAIRIQRNRNRSMPESLTHNFRMNPSLQGVSCMCMAKVMEPDALHTGGLN